MALTNAVVAPRYARALFEAAQDTDQLDNVHTELDALREILTQNAGLLPTLTAVTVSQENKQALVDTLKQGASSLVANLVQVSFEYGRIAALPAIIADFEQRYADSIGQLDATITTAVELNATQQQALSQAIAARFGAKQVQLTTTIDPSVLGGVMVQTRTAVIDGTVRTRLAKLRAQLLAK
ncbi:MAG: F0F1 ATP synthase subunit delta [Lactobacillus sp.]|jgi:F-type H+-transporting ATPase subunit delta|nr:F0F1 ATP synthase subunit delta [Lactobacillus sp.]